MRRLPAGVFISYRRSETGPYARLLREELRRHLAWETVFMDVESIEGGVDFADAIRRALDACAVMLALIGPAWLTVTDPTGRRRLDDPDDLVRLEIEAALARGIRVVPVLVDGTAMPHRRDLPDSVAPLTRLTAVELSHTHRYGYELGRLVETTLLALGSSPPGRTGHRRPPPSPGLNAVRYEDALRALDEAVRTGRDEEALHDAEPVVADDPYSLTLRGIARLNLGRYEDALEDLDRALEWEPDDGPRPGGEAEE